jgi:pimeloyl-ACP methyl ester carboxylesterase
MSVGFAKSYAVGRVVAGQEDVVYLPRNGVRGKRGVVLLHGHNQTVQHFLAPALAGQFALAETIAAAGLACVAINAEGNGWATDQVIADIDSARTYLGTLGCASDKLLLLGVSMGGANMFNYARAHPDRVAALIGCIPASDMNDLRDNDRGAAGVRDAINTDWGLPAGSTSGTNPLPARANPLVDANAAAIAGSGALIKMYYSTADTTVIPSTVTALAAKLGISPIVVDNVSGHSDATLAKLPLNEVVQSLYSHA